MNNETTETTMYVGDRDAQRSAHVYRVLGDKHDKLPMRWDLANHSPDGPEWGYGGSGPSQLSLAMLADALGRTETGDAIALAFYQQFKWRFTAGLEQEKRWSVTRERVLCELVEIIKSDIKYARQRIDEAIIQRLYPAVDSWVAAAEERGEDSGEINYDELEHEMRERIARDFHELLAGKVKLAGEVCDSVCSEIG